MTHVAVLDPRTHGALRLSPSLQVSSPGQLCMVAVVAKELDRVAVEAPICFIKDGQTGQFGMFALLGLRPGENRMVGPDGAWLGRYVPLDVRRGPFGLAMRDGQAALTIDLANPRVAAAEGEALFDAGGQPSAGVRSAQAALSEMMAGVAVTRDLIRAICDHRLMAPAKIALGKGDEAPTLEGWYAIDTKALAALPGPALEALSRQGYLFAIHLLAISMINLERLI
ncbi:SapC family protein [Caulobacter sp. X]|uniref:SapC family protein n=1 Tax=Caulobacter sp. X TaxID=2048901 RepID=UPI0013747412|nr:SapC family protein [Caulobacter sp. X]